MQEPVLQHQSRGVPVHTGTGWGIGEWEGFEGSKVGCGQMQKGRA